MRRLLINLFLAFLLVTTVASAQEPPVVVPSESAIVDDDANLALKRSLDARYTQLLQRFRAWEREASAYNSRYGGRSYDAESAEASAGAAEQARLSQLLQEYERDAESFKADVARLRLEPETARIIKGMNALAKRLGWSKKKRDRLDSALKQLDAFGGPKPRETVNLTWQAIEARGADSELAREASRGDGPGFPGAGTQTVFQDCTIFALANAAALPYGVVAARATELLRQGDWRAADERAHPQEVIERHGLNGGEVIMLAEAFGRAEVVPRADFARTLKKGHRLLIDVVPPGGEGEHEVVLTKTFRHNGEAWYEMMESNHGPQRRLYLSGRELNIILLCNGVAFRPEKATTPKLLR